MIRTAYLRSYLLEASLPRYERLSGAPAGSWQGDDVFLWREREGDDAFSVEWDGDSYICPRHFRLRKLEGMLAFNNAFPDAGLIPHSQIVDASTQLEALRDTAPSMRSYILTSPWHVPIRWFAAFLHEERELYERGAGISVRYRTTMAAAQIRVDRAADILVSAGFDPAVVGQLKSLASWLDAFPADGLLELDYGSVADLFSDGDLVLDESAADVAAALLALEQGGLPRSGQFYETLMRRWGRAQSLAFSN